MLDVLQFVLGSFWRFAGTAVLLCIIADGAVGVARALRRREGA